MAYAHLDFTEPNANYVTHLGGRTALPIPPSKRLVIVTCMDARIDPAGQLGVKEGDAHVIRNAGGSAKEALRSIIISQRLLGTREIAVFHHTGCGMTTFTTPQLQSKVKGEHPADAVVAKQVEGINFLEFSDLEISIREDVEFLKHNPLVLKETVTTGWTFDVETGKIHRVV